MKWTITLCGIWLAVILATQGDAVMPNARTPPSDGSEPVKLGKVDFTISCAPAVRGEFNRGISLLHSFWHDQAFVAFNNVASADPNCALAYWGQAMTHFHQLLASPTAADIQAGTAELAQADRATEKSRREAAYISALHRFFDGYRQQDYLQQATAYANAMAEISKAYPKDLESHVFYALALLAADPPEDVQLVNPRRAFAILEPLFREHPDHPGIAHYIIHACDNPRMAPEGLNAARHYAQIAPQVPHALHMPAHIFARLGAWQDDIDSNLASKRASEAAALHHGAEHRLHAMEFLEYAYLQTGRFDEANAIVTEAKSVLPTDVDPRYPNMWTSVEARYPSLLAIETKNWTMAGNLQFNTEASPSAQESTLLAHAEAAAHLRDEKAANDVVRQLESLASADQRLLRSTGAIEIRAWADFTLDNLKNAVAALQTLAQRQAKIGKGEVEIPACEMLAEMLLLRGRPAEALTQYQRSLVSDPNRFGALWGAGQAAERLGRDDLAASYYRKLLVNCPKADRAVIMQIDQAISMLSLHQ